MGWSTADRIVVRGLDLPGEILGRLNLGDMAFLELTGRVPNENESRMFNALVVTLVEHGVTPSALVARLTYLGAPEAMQAAVAAGLCGLGSYRCRGLPFGRKGRLDFDKAPAVRVAPGKQARG